MTTHRCTAQLLIAREHGLYWRDAKCIETEDGVVELPVCSKKYDIRTRWDVGAAVGFLKCQFDVPFRVRRGTWLTAGPSSIRWKCADICHRRCAEPVT
jgi:hypothetical protein